MPDRRRRRRAARERWTIHSVRGLVDTASPLGARWIDDEACDDEFSREAVAAQRALFRPIDVRWPDGHRRLVNGLAGDNRSPSLVWHAQAIGVLLELGFLPTANCVREHLEVIERRLQPINCHDPEQSGDDDPWLLRTRHVAWVLACLGEMPRIELAPGDATDLRERLAAAVAQHRRIVDTALTYLLGLAEEGPATWVGRRRGEDVWTEVWKERQPNLLNTLYAMLALCRAERHGYLERLELPFGGVSHATALFGDLLKEVIIETKGQPTVRWRRPWLERWAHHDLPSGVVALLALTLTEYASLLLETSAPESAEEEMRALAARSRAQRLAEVLVARTESAVTDWRPTADAFYSEKAEGAWFIPTYSTALRAILETGVVHPRHPVVVNSFAVIQQLATERPHNGELLPTWLDPTRDSRLTGEVGIRQQRVADFGRMVGDANLGRPTASGLHASCMAWAGLRRAVARVDPRDLMDDAARITRSPFERIEAERDGRGWALTLFGDGAMHCYVESARLTDNQFRLLLALDRFDEPAPPEAIVRVIAELAGMKRSLKPASLRQKIARLNARFATELIGSDGPRHYLASSLLVR
jgi:hypothetical protein